MHLVKQHVMLGVLDGAMSQVTNQGVNRRKRPGPRIPLTGLPLINAHVVLLTGSVLPSSTTLVTKALIFG